MKLHRLTLRNFRGVIDRTVEFPEVGIVVVEGDNEAGKTSMVEALEMLLNEKDSTRKKNVLATQPVGQDTGTEVEAQLSVGPYRFTYRKRWHRQPLTELHFSAPRPEQLSGVGAHERVEEILNSETDMALFRALQVLQGADVTAQPEFMGNAALRVALESASGTVYSDEGDSEGLLEKIRDEYSQYFTPSGRETGDYRKSKTVLEAAEERLEGAQHRVHEVVTRVEDHARLEVQVSELSVELNRYRESRDQLQNRFDEVQRHLQQVEDARETLDHRRRESEVARDNLQRREERITERKDRIKKSDRLTKEHQELRERRERLKKGERTARKNYEAAESEVAALNSTVRALRKQVDLEQLRERKERESQRLAQVETLEKEIAELTTELRDGITEDDVKKITDAENAVIQAKAAWDVAVPKVYFKSHRKMALTVNGEEREVATGEEFEHAVDPFVELEMDQLASLRIEAGTGEEDRKQNLQDSRAKLRQLLAELGVSSGEAAQESLARSQQLNVDLRHSREHRKILLNGGTIEDLRAEAAALTKRVNEANDALPYLEENHDGEEHLRKKEEELANGQTQLVEIREHWESERELLRQIDLAAAHREAEKAEAETEARRALKSLEDERSRQGDNDLREALEHAERDEKTAQQTLQELEERLAVLSIADLELQLDTANKSYERVRIDLEEHQEARRTAEIELKVMGSEGRQGELDDARTEHAHHERSYRVIDRRARAAKRLYDTVMRHQEQTWQRYVAPIQEQVSALGRLVYGHDVEFWVTSDLEIGQRTLHGKTLDFTQLSTGAQEQIGIIARLACAQLVSSSSAVPVMIDDALGNTDPERLRNLGALFSSAAQNSQIIILTCTPQRYRAVGEAQVVRL